MGKKIDIYLAVLLCYPTAELMDDKLRKMENKSNKNGKGRQIYRDEQQKILRNKPNCFPWSFSPPLPFFFFCP